MLKSKKLKKCDFMLKSKKLKKCCVIVKQILYKLIYGDIYTHM